MGTRVVNSDFWRDEVVENFSAEDKYFWLYLLTNPQANLLGIYKITRKTIAFEMGYSIETVNSLLDRFENRYKLIKYRESEIAIKNYLRHGIIKGGLPIYNSLMKSLREVKHKEFIRWIYNNISGRDDVVPTVFNAFETYLENNSIKDILNENDDEYVNGDVYVNEYVNGDVNEYVNVNVNEVTQPLRSRNAAVTQTVTKKPHPSEPFADVSALILNDGTEWLPYQKDFEEYERLYPAVDVRQQFNEMRAWCINNPKKRKTKSGIKRFVGNWLSGEQNKGGNNMSYKARQSVQAKPFAEIAQDIAGWKISGGDK